MARGTADGGSVEPVAAAPSRGRPRQTGDGRPPCFDCDELLTPPHPAPPPVPHVGREPTESEADEAGTDEQDPDYTGTATIAVDEATLPEDEAAEAEALAALATVGQADAESAALATVSGEVLEAELDDENGFVIWSIEVRDGAGTVHDVAIDAGNGQVLGTQADEDGAED